MARANGFPLEMAREIADGHYQERRRTQTAHAECTLAEYRLGGHLYPRKIASASLRKYPCSCWARSFFYPCLHLLRAAYPGPEIAACSVITLLVGAVVVGIAA